MSIREWHEARPPLDAFKGTNMITPEVLYYLCGKLNGHKVYVEISRERPPYFSRSVGRDPDGGPLYGLTFKLASGEKPDPDPSTCKHSMREVTVYLEGLHEAP